MEEGEFDSAFSPATPRTSRLVAKRNRMTGFFPGGARIAAMGFGASGGTDAAGPARESRPAFSGDDGHEKCLVVSLDLLKRSDLMTSITADPCRLLAAREDTLLVSHSAFRGIGAATRFMVCTYFPRAAMHDDENALDRIWAEALPAIRAHVARKLGGAAADHAEDVLHETLIGFRQAMRRYAARTESVTNPAAVAMRVAQHKTSDFFRRHYRAERLQDALTREATALGAHAAPDTSPFRGEVMTRFRFTLREAVRLRPECGQLFELRALGMPWEAISALLGEPVDRLKKRFERCRKFLLALVHPDDRDDFREVAYE